MKTRTIKIIILAIIAFAGTACYTHAQDTMYVYKAGAVVSKRAIVQIDSITFKTSLQNIAVTDIDGNVYHTVTIGTKTWMVENLRTTKYRNGDIIGTTSFPTKSISAENTPKYQWPWNGNESDAAYYGRLYTWYAVSDNRNIAPIGWHVASDTEWTILENFLISNGYNYDGTITGNKIAKSLASNTDWFTSSYIGVIGNDLTKNNTSGFTALPCGIRYDFESLVFFLDMGYYCYWWTSSEQISGHAWIRYMSGSFYDSISLFRNYSSGAWGYSVRCVKD